MNDAGVALEQRAGLLLAGGRQVGGRGGRAGQRADDLGGGVAGGRGHVGVGLVALARRSSMIWPPPEATRALIHTM